MVLYAIYFVARTLHFIIHFKSAAILYWQVFIIAALKSLTDDSNISIILESASVDCFSPGELRFSLVL